MLVLAPETERVMHRDRTKERPQDCHPVKVENLCRIVENCPLLDMYLPMQKSLEKPVPFWTVTITHEKEKANMELIDVAVSVGGFDRDTRGTRGNAWWHHASVLH